MFPDLHTECEYARPFVDLEGTPEVAWCGDGEVIEVWVGSGRSIVAVGGRTDTAWPFERRAVVGVEGIPHGVSEVGIPNQVAWQRRCIPQVWGLALTIELP
jgi:hypothetical protein